MRRKREPKRLDDTSRATIWEVAALAGVSTATVSRVLNDHAHVSEETRAKVVQAVRDLGFVSHRQLFTHADTQPVLIGITSVSMSEPEYAEILAGITESLHAHNARPVVCPISRRHNCGMPLLERFMHGSTQGGLILGSVEHEADIRGAQQSGFPIVVIQSEVPLSEDIPVVASADWLGAKTLTEYLLSLQHTRLALITRQGLPHCSKNRLAGFQSALFSAGLSFSPEMVYEGDGDYKQQGYEAAMHFFSLPKRPTAIMAFDDAMAIGVLQAAQECRIQIPQELSVVGYNDLGLARMATPELTTMRQPFMEMGRVGGDMLCRLIRQQPLEVTRVELSTRLIVRSSTAICPRPGRKISLGETKAM